MLARRAHKEWSTKAVKDAVFASPLFPRLLNGDLIRDTIAKGVSNGILAYVGKAASGKYEPFLFGASMTAQEVEISDDVFLITAEVAEAYRQALTKPQEVIGAGPLFVEGGGAAGTGGAGAGIGETETPGVTKPEMAPAGDRTRALTWSGEVPAQKWMNFYTKVLAKFATTKSLRLTVNVDVAPPEGVTKQSVEETKAALRELGLNDDTLRT